MGFGGQTAIEAIKKLVFQGGHRRFSERLFNNQKRPSVQGSLPPERARDETGDEEQTQGGPHLT
jgi:hypothetical protein